MNNQIAALHGKDMLRKIHLFECISVKISHRTANLNFLKKCRDNKIIPCFAKIKHHLKKNNENAFTELSLSIIRGEIRRSRRELDALSKKAYNLHTTLANNLRIDFWINVEAGTALKAERALEKANSMSPQKIRAAQLN